jgi:MscS family membrane protein
MFLHEYLNKVLGAYAIYAWLFHGIIILLVAGLIHFSCKRLFAKLKVKLADTHNIWDHSVLHAARQPFFFCIWFVALTLIAKFFLLDLNSLASLQEISTVLELGITFVLVWFLWRLIYKVETQVVIPFAWRRPSDPTTVAIVARLLRIFLSVIAVLIVMQIFGVPVTGLWAFGGGGTIIIGFAAQDLLANFFGGLMIFLDRPFKVGDWISSPDRQIEGTVQFIGWRTTKVITFEQRPLYLPNSIFTKIIIVNPQRMTNRRIETTVGLRYDDAKKIKPIVDDIRSLLKEHDALDQKQTQMVHFLRFGDSSLDVNVYCFTKTINWAEWREVQQEVYMSILAIIDQHGAEVAFPTRTLNIPPQSNLTGVTGG